MRHRFVCAHNTRHPAQAKQKAAAMVRKGGSCAGMHSTLQACHRLAWAHHRHTTDQHGHVVGLQEHVAL